MVYYPTLALPCAVAAISRTFVRHVAQAAADAEHTIHWPPFSLRLTSASFNDDAEVTGHLPPTTSRHNETTTIVGSCTSTPKKWGGPMWARCFATGSARGSVLRADPAMGYISLKLITIFDDMACCPLPTHASTGESCLILIHCRGQLALPLSRVPRTRAPDNRHPSSTVLEICVAVTQLCIPQRGGCQEYEVKKGPQAAR
jgi:hypothetical protein